MDKEIKDLYADYKDGKYTRRSFFRRLALITGSSAAAMALFPVLEENELKAATAQKKAPELVTEFIKYPAETGDMRAFLARPKKGKKFPGVIVIHENRGLVPHIQDVTRRMAGEGFLALAPDALSPLGGTPEDISNVGAMFKQLDSEKTTKNFVAAVKYLKTNPLCTGKVGCTGFCWGGAMTNQVAVNAPDLDAAVPYYGRQPAAEDVEKIKAPVMAHYAGNDAGINAGIPAFEEALKKYGKEYQIFMYEGASHAFNNDSNPERYNEQAAKLAWGRTIAFFKEKLK
ncbi:MAG TPA: dienelactone hydrolase family protein [Bacteroidales bacterium]|jgi:carboxymethylenebutenolidase|nr:dienelactone hydrolase family protein [Bacteroidales bacterium]